MGRNTRKELPRIPAVKTYADFRAFSQAGRDLAHWHLNYETVAMNEEVIVDAGKHKEGGHSCPPDANVATGVSPLLKYRVTKMTFSKSFDDRNPVIDDNSIALENILEAVLKMAGTVLPLAMRDALRVWFVPLKRPWHSAAVLRMRGE